LSVSDSDFIIGDTLNNKTKSLKKIDEEYKNSPISFLNKKLDLK